MATIVCLEVHAANCVLFHKGSSCKSGPLGTRLSGATFTGDPPKAKLVNMLSARSFW